MRACVFLSRGRSPCGATIPPPPHTPNPPSPSTLPQYFASFIHTDFAGVRNYCMVMELCMGGTLRDVTINARNARAAIPECQIGVWIHEMLSALHYLHDRVCASAIASVWGVRVSGGAPAPHGCMLA